jgi:hypothetical protein
MRKISLLSLVVVFLAIAPGLVDEACPENAPKRIYQYVSLDAAVPEGFSFTLASITNSGGTLCSSPESCFVAVYRRGEITVLHEGSAGAANNRGTVGGSVLLDPI